MTFRDRGTEDIFNGVDSKAARKTCPQEVVSRARAKLFILDDAESLEDLLSPPGNRLEGLKGDRKGQHSIRINDQYRICFRWTENEPRDVEIVDYH
jgi:toxin HigB-1